MDARNGKTDVRSARTFHKGKMQVFDDACSIQPHKREEYSDIKVLSRFDDSERDSAIYRHKKHFMTIKVYQFDENLACFSCRIPYFCPTKGIYK